MLELRVLLETKQPINDEIRQARIDSLYQKDADSTIRFSHENPQIQAVYKEFYSKPFCLGCREQCLYVDEVFGCRPGVFL